MGLRGNFYDDKDTLFRDAYIRVDWARGGKRSGYQGQVEMHRSKETFLAGKAPIMVWTKTAPSDVPGGMGLGASAGPREAVEGDARPTTAAFEPNPFLPIYAALKRDFPNAVDD